MQSFSSFGLGILDLDIVLFDTSDCFINHETFILHHIPSCQYPDVLHQIFLLNVISYL